MDIIIEEPKQTLKLTKDQLDHFEYLKLLNYYKNNGTMSVD